MAESWYESVVPAVKECVYPLQLAGTLQFAGHQQIVFQRKMTGLLLLDLLTEEIPFSSLAGLEICRQVTWRWSQQKQRKFRIVYIFIPYHQNPGNHFLIIVLLKVCKTFFPPSAINQKSKVTLSIKSFWTCINCLCCQQLPTAAENKSRKKVKLMFRNVPGVEGNSSSLFTISLQAAQFTLEWIAQHRIGPGLLCLHVQASSRSFSDEDVHIQDSEERWFGQPSLNQRESLRVYISSFIILQRCGCSHSALCE